MGGVCQGPRVNYEDNAKKDFAVNLVLLGKPGVGKSTVFRQLTLLYTKQVFNKEARMNSVFGILRALCHFERVLVDKVQAGGIELAADILETHRILQEIFDQINVHNDELKENKQVATRTKETFLLLQKVIFHNELVPFHAEILNEDRSDQSCASAYFIGRLVSIVETVDEFVPDNSDMLHVRMITDTAASVNFSTKMKWPPNSQQMKDVAICCTDMGGQEEFAFDWVEKSKGATAILHVLCLSDFDSLDENDENKLQASINQIQMFSASKYFEEKHAIILFNKTDILEEKLKSTEVKKYFPEYSGDNTVESMQEYFAKVVKRVVKSTAVVDSQTSHVSVMNICAVDTNIMKVVLSKVLLQVFREMIRQVYH